MSTPKFIQITGGRYDVYGLDETGRVWLFGNHRPDNLGEGKGERDDYRECWILLPNKTLEEAWPEIQPKSPSFEECLIPPPSVDEEAAREVEDILSGRR